MWFEEQGKFLFQQVCSRLSTCEFVPAGLFEWLPYPPKPSAWTDAAPTVVTPHGEDAFYTVSFPAWWIPTFQLIYTEPVGFMFFLLTLCLGLWEVMKHIFLVLPGARPGSQFDLRSTAVLQSQTALIELSISSLSLTYPNPHMKHGTMSLLGNNKQWIMVGAEEEER